MASALERTSFWVISEGASLTGTWSVNNPILNPSDTMNIRLSPCNSAAR